MTLAALAFGGNLGDVRAAFARTLERLSAAEAVEVTVKSSLYRTPPWGPVAQPPYLNMAVLVQTRLSAHGLLDLALALEKLEGRVRSERFGPRTLDIDILLFGNENISDERLTIPHPRLLERAFALVPLAEIAPDWRIGGISIAEAVAHLDSTGIETLTA